MVARSTDGEPDDWQDVRVFGDPIGEFPGTVRPSAYGIVSDGHGRLAVVRTPLGYFLPGGGRDAAETVERTVIREAAEECGLMVEVGGWRASAIEHVPSAAERAHYEKRSWFCEAAALGSSDDRIESDHELLWMAPAGALTALTPPSHRWAVEQWMAARDPEAPIIHVITADEWRAYRDLRLRALTESPDAFGSMLVWERDRADADWRRRLEGATDRRFQLPVLARLRDQPIGLAWGCIRETRPESANVYQMWVAPEARGHGVGRLLLDGVVDWARRAGAQLVELNVTCGDTPARRMYERAGFEAVGDPEPLRSGSQLMKQPMRLLLNQAAG